MYWLDMPITVAGDDLDGVVATLRAAAAHQRARSQFEGDAAPPPATRGPDYRSAFVEPRRGRSGRVRLGVSGDRRRTRDSRVFGYLPLAGISCGWRTPAGMDVQGRDAERRRRLGNAVRVAARRRRPRPHLHRSLERHRRVGAGRGRRTARSVLVFPTDAQAWTNYGSQAAAPEVSARATRRDSSASARCRPATTTSSPFPRSRPRDWRDPKMLEALARVATQVSIGEGEHKTIDLRMRRGAPVIAGRSARAVACRDRRQRRQAHPRATRVRSRRPPAGTIAGVVVSDDAQPRPLRRARVTVNGPTLQVPRTAITGDDGTFAFGGLPAGRYTLAARRRTATSPMTHGAARPARPGTPRGARAGETQARHAAPAARRRHHRRRHRRRRPAGAGIGSPRSRRRLHRRPTGERRLVSAGRRAVRHRRSRRLSDLRTAGRRVRRRGAAAAAGRRPAGGPKCARCRPRTSSARGVTHDAGVLSRRDRRRRARRASRSRAGEERSGIDMQLQYVPLATVSGTRAGRAPA